MKLERRVDWGVRIVNEPWKLKHKLTVIDILAAIIRESKEKKNDGDSKKYSSVGRPTRGKT